MTNPNNNMFTWTVDKLNCSVNIIIQILFLYC